MNELDILVSILGEEQLKFFQDKKLNHIFDFMLILPSYYLDTYNTIFKIRHMSENTYVYIRAKIVSCIPKKKCIICKVKDNTGIAFLYFFGFLYHTGRELMRFKSQGRYCSFKGKTQHSGYSTITVITQAEIIYEETLHRFLPQYATKHKMPASKYQEVFTVLKNYQVSELIPDVLLAKYELCNINTAFQSLHWPSSDREDEFYQQKSRALERLKLEETLAYFSYKFRSKEQFYLKNNLKHSQVKVDLASHAVFIKNLPFEITDAQKKVIHEILEDFEDPKKPMMRLLQGDVGSGKTIVVAAAVLQTSLNNMQSIVLVPTTILAEQHTRTFEELLQPFKISVVKIAGTPFAKIELDNINEILSNNHNCVVVGTTSVFSKKLRYTNPEFLIIDEQHRFGVQTRNKLISKLQLENKMPHTLLLSATPIPRTLMSAQYSHIDISIMDELPSNRKKTETLIISYLERTNLIKSLLSLVKDHKQIYWVCSLIEDEQYSNGVQSTYHNINEILGPKVRVGMIHGKLQRKIIDSTLQNFKNHKLDILVTTTVIEVGVNVPNATVIIIEDAHKFGLAQIHQLRGRVGRGNQQSYCILLYGVSCSIKARKRLNILKHNSDGIKLAELDLLTRGPGSLLGNEQAGKGKWNITDWTESRQYLERAHSLYKELDKDIIDLIIARWVKDELS